MPALFFKIFIRPKNLTLTQHLDTLLPIDSNFWVFLALSHIFKSQVQGRRSSAFPFVRDCKDHLVGDLLLLHLELWPTLLEMPTGW